MKPSLVFYGLRHIEMHKEADFSKIPPAVLDVTEMKISRADFLENGAVTRKNVIRMVTCLGPIDLMIDDPQSLILLAKLDEFVPETATMEM